MQKNIAWLSSLRGIGCLFVLAAHLGASSTNYGMYFNGCGKIGVWLFMIFSGFWFLYPLCQRQQDLNGQNLMGYYGKKIIRIMIPYLAVLLISMGLGFIPDGKELLRHLLLIDGFGHFWYMPVIMKFFLIAPLFWLLQQMIKDKKWLFAVIAGIGIVLAVVFPFTTYTENSTQLRWYVPVFLMGMLLAIIWEAWNNWKENSIGADVIVLVLVLILFSFTPWLRQKLWGIDPSAYLQNKYLLMGGLWCFIILGIVKGKIWKAWLNKSRVLQWIGEISFPLYLIHFPILMRLNATEIGWAKKVIIVLVTSILLAAILHWGVEKPCITLSRKLTEHKKTEKEEK
ncbi:MAG: acyltransferase [Lachnospiraceae bacterium]|nr:acyltransferase [Lachnospiraceae bacterium]